MNDPRIQAILEQLDTLILLLLRPVVQQQLLAFFLVTLVAWLTPLPFRYLTNWLEKRIGAAPRPGDDKPQPVTWRTRLIRWTRAAEFVLFPILGLLLGGFAVGRLDQDGIPSGLLARLNNLFWLLLTYRSRFLWRRRSADRTTMYRRSLRLSPIPPPPGAWSRSYR